jgi:hypothetical protein
MTTFLIIALVIVMVLVLVSLVRGIVAFLQTTKIDLESGEAEQVTEMQLKQNRMMMNRIMFQGLAILIVVLILAAAS